MKVSVKDNTEIVSPVVLRKYTYTKKILQNYQLYLFILPTIIYFIIFHYLPMYGVLIAFKDFVATKGIISSPWVGFKHFERFFDSYQFWRLIKNTLGLSVLQLIVGFPLPILLALMLNQIRSEKYKRFVQTVVYAPHFISVVVLAGMIYVFFSNNGLVNNIIMIFGGEPISFMAKPEWFKPLYVASGVWQETGWAAIIYLAALAGVNPELHEAAVVDGANKWQRILHVDIPAIMPTAVIVLILSVGNIMNVGFEKAYLLQTPLNQPSAEVIPTYVYKMGLQQAQYSFSAAVGLFNAVINLILLIAVNKFAKKISGQGLW
ncbi:putative aldouronate transport system permease protein [Anoxybacillus voinovskiensis]|uniref:Putative aldouronate transport system permease protein n=1 Tax=Anoxybacteroides voinovskiense TaxID=230470 RepID=A0A840DU71_9BACL|nr:ABC transporter permease subunit [Anoxybacillus voinovskiensis]MBB4073059.1 putative aldouronate transport system permease protein [Anoxybacillus voinovskiensis]GGJ59788.1 sugar ABC transporter permease [Anoxybacillus voinovskiensis]